MFVDETNRFVRYEPLVETIKYSFIIIHLPPTLTVGFKKIIYLTLSALIDDYWRQFLTKRFRQIAYN